MRVYFIESDILIRWHHFDEQKQLIWWTAISVLVVYDHIFGLHQTINLHLLSINRILDKYVYYDLGKTGP